MRRRSVVVLAVALSAVASTGVAAVEWHERLGGPPIDVKIVSGGTGGGKQLATLGVTTDVAAVFTMAFLHVGEEVVIERVRAIQVDPTVTVHTSRVMLVGRPTTYPGLVATNGGIGSTCVRWPSRGFGPAYRAVGMTLPAKSAVNLAMWASTTRHHGVHTFEGVEITVRRVGSRKRVTLRDPTVRRELHAVTPQVFDNPGPTDSVCRAYDDEKYAHPYPGVPT